MYLFLFSVLLISIGILLLTTDLFHNPTLLFSNGYKQANSNPYYFFGKQQRHKKSNMLRISKLRRKK